jgi:membrane protease YdiL (CAAX protease family)
VRTIFIGRDGIRAGWRIAIFLLIFAVEIAVLTSILFIVARFVPSLHDALSGRGRTTLTPLTALIGDGVAILLLLCAAYVMSRIESRPIGAYGLPARTAFGRRFWEGALWGFAAIAAVMGAIAACGDLSIVPASHGIAIAGGLLLWALGFIMVGLFEEFLFRGYLLFTLARGIGFVPAALVLGVLFALAHGRNPGETPAGLAAIVIYALVFSVALWRTGTLWFAVGFHAAFDWGETAFFGTPDSGFRPSDNFLASSFHGATLTSGGTVGPEGSIFAPIALLIVLALIVVRFPRPAFAAA